jgi:hypothetical protein
MGQRLKSLLASAPRVLPRLHQARESAPAPIQKSRLPPYSKLLENPHECRPQALFFSKTSASLKK